MSKIARFRIVSVVRERREWGLPHWTVKAIPVGYYNEDVNFELGSGMVEGSGLTYEEALSSVADKLETE